LHGLDTQSPSRPAPLADGVSMGSAVSSPALLLPLSPLVRVSEGKEKGRHCARLVTSVIRVVSMGSLATDKNLL